MRKEEEEEEERRSDRPNIIEELLRVVSQLLLGVSFFNQLRKE